LRAFDSFLGKASMLTRIDYCIKVFFMALFIGVCGLSDAKAVDLTRLTNSVMNGWRADFQEEMGKLIGSSSCSSSVNVRNLTNSVMNKWRADYQREMGALVDCLGCSRVDLSNLTNSVMNGWRADFQRQMTILVDCKK
jgi:hypothetical protein